MTRKADPEVATQAARRLQSMLFAMADKDHDVALELLNAATDPESRWMVSSLLGQVAFMAEVLAGYAKKSATGCDLLRSAARGMDIDVAEIGVTVTVEAAMRREGLS